MTVTALSIPVTAEALVIASEPAPDQPRGAARLYAPRTALSALDATMAPARRRDGEYSAGRVLGWRPPRELSHSVSAAPGLAMITRQHLKPQRTKPVTRAGRVSRPGSGADSATTQTAATSSISQDSPASRLSRLRAEPHDPRLPGARSPEPGARAAQRTRRKPRPGTQTQLRAPGPGRPDPHRRLNQRQNPALYDLNCTSPQHHAPEFPHLTRRGAPDWQQGTGARTRRTRAAVANANRRK
jgi:hypothetical protein